MKKLYTTLLLLISAHADAQYYNYLHTYDTTADGARSIILQTDNSLLVVGAYLRYNDNHEDACWYHFSQDGDVIINKKHIHTDAAAWYMNYSGNAKPLSNGGYVLPYTWFHYNPDPDRYQAMATLVFLDAQLDTVAVKRYTDSSFFSEALNDCAVLQDGSYILGGEQASSYISQQTFSKGMVMRVDVQGNLMWKQVYQKEAGKACFMNSVQPLDNNRSLIGGSSRDVLVVGLDYYLRYKPWFVIIDNNNGNILKDTLYSQGYASGGVAYKDMNGGYFHTGRKDSIVNTQYLINEENFPAYIAHLDTNLRIDWLTSMPHSYQPYMKDIWRPKQLQNGDFLLCGSGIQGNANAIFGWVARISNSGAILWSKYYYSQVYQYAYLTDFVERPDGNIILCGWTENDTLPSWHGQDLWLLGLYASGVVLTGSAAVGNTNVKTMEFSLYPNPAKDVFYLEVPEPGTAELYDMGGRRVAMYEVKKGKSPLRLPDAVASGNYLLQFTGGQSGMIAGKGLVKQ